MVWLYVYSLYPGKIEVIEAKIAQVKENLFLLDLSWGTKASWDFKAAVASSSAIFESVGDGNDNCVWILAMKYLAGQMPLVNYLSVNKLLEFVRYIPLFSQK